MLIKERHIHRYLIFSIILVLFVSLFADLLDLYSAKYASISVELLKKDDWLKIQHGNIDYIDLPPLLFWLSTLSFKFFGISNFSYKLFGVIFAIIGIYSTFQITNIYYGQRAGRIAAIILGTTQGLFSLVLNLEAEPLLLGAMIFAIWQITEYLRHHQSKNFLLGLFGISLAMLAQGLIGLLIPIFVIGSDLVLRQKWKEIFKWQWSLGLITIAVLLSPMIYGLGKQLGNNISAVYFFFVEQPFRTTTKIDGSSIVYIIWVFLPWAMLFILAFVDKLRTSWIHIKTKKSAKYAEHISILGFIISILVLLASKHLPQSIYILSPFAAIFTAAYIDKMKPKNHQIIYKSQAFLIFALWFLSFLLLFYIFTPVNIILAIISFLLFAVTIWSLFKLPQKKAIVVSTAIWAISFALIQSNHVYPVLSNYQSGVQVGKWLNEHSIESTQFCNFRIRSNAEEFYSEKIIKTKRRINQISPNDRFIYTDEIGLNMVKEAAIPYLIMKEYSEFNIFELNLTFLNPKTRPNELAKRYLIAIYPKGE